MPRKLPDVSTTQLIASAVATGAAALGASYLGVYGTIIGAALMSVISTAGAAVGKHYLDQGKDQLRELTQLQAAARRRGAAEGAADEATSADPTRTVVWSGHPNATRRFGSASGGDPNATRYDPLTNRDPNATRFDLPSGGAAGHGDPNATRLDPVDAVAASLAEAAGEDAVRQAARRSAWESTVEWARAHWVTPAASSAVVFAIVIGGITIYEATTGQALGKGGSGLTVTNVLGGGGGQQDDDPSPAPSGDPSEPGATPGETPTGDAPSTQPTTPDGQSTTQPTQQPTGQPTTPPTSSVPTAPDTPAPTEGPPDGGGQEPGGADPQAPAG
ncbi:hypothetical protein ETD83_04610 [Actinomadura soli]|uniref:Uncharacterized protein n=1 Tax=Actinomadura soli TaxID=2508997 RepID=A0A5C4JJ93_9ACTN|nr:hypothetical protein [Actinomadura soli]TMR06495.1 hypothetical protein ETD83_04610 [Actinomadura soli]